MLTTFLFQLKCDLTERLWWSRRMSDAVEGAEVMIYGVSRRYKESANCRLEANYAHQQG